jgi:hypothetical protein
VLKTLGNVPRLRARSVYFVGHLPRKLSGADLLQTLVFGSLTHPEVSWEMLASIAATRQVQVTDTAVHKRFSKPCAQFLHAILEEMTSVIVEADWEVPFELLQRFETVVLEDSSSIALPVDTTCFTSQHRGPFFQDMFEGLLYL